MWKTCGRDINSRIGSGTMKHQLIVALLAQWSLDLLWGSLVWWECLWYKWESEGLIMWDFEAGFSLLFFLGYGKFWSWMSSFSSMHEMISVIYSVTLCGHFIWLCVLNFKNTRQSSCADTTQLSATFFVIRYCIRVYESNLVFIYY